MADVIALGDFRFTRKHHRTWDKRECQHKNTELDDNGNIVMCIDCGKQVDPYFVLRMLTEDWGRIQSAIEAKRQTVENEKERHIHLIAARKVESAWRNKHMVPTCPHCGEGISAHDGFGDSAISKQIDNARRLHRAATRAAAQTNSAPNPPNAQPAA